jgi:hypothetical protein
LSLEFNLELFVWLNIWCILSWLDLGLPDFAYSIYRFYIFECFSINFAFSSSTIYISSICFINSSLLSDNLWFLSLINLHSFCNSERLCETSSNLASYSDTINFYFSISLFASVFLLFKLLSSSIVYFWLELISL